MAGNLKNLFSKVKKNGTSGAAEAGRPPRLKAPGRGHGLTVLSMDGSVLKVLHASGPVKKRLVDHAAVLDVTDYSEDQTALKLKEYLTGEGLLGDPVVLVNHPHFTRARVLKLPSTDPAELEIIIDLQIEKLTPDAKEDTISYFRILDSDASGYSHVLVVMAHQDMISRMMRIVEQAGARSAGAASGVDGLVQWYRGIHPSPSGADGARAVLLVDIDSRYTSVMVMYRGEAYFHRSIPIGSSLFKGPDREKHIALFLGEIHRSLIIYDEEEFKWQCSKVVLTGRLDEAAGLALSLEAEMKMPVETVPAHQPFHFREEIVQKEGDSGPGGFASLAGFLTGKIEGDLTPLSVRLQKTFEKKVRSSVVLAFQTLLAILLIAGFLVKDTQHQTQYRNWLLDQADQMQGPARELDTEMGHLKIVQERIGERGILLDALATINAVTPPEVRWDQFTYNKGQNILIKGVSREMPKVFEMVTELEKSGLFVKPEVRRVTKKQVDNRDITVFELVTPFSAEGAESVEDQTA